MGWTVYVNHSVISVCILNSPQIGFFMSQAVIVKSKAGSTVQTKPPTTNAQTPEQDYAQETIPSMSVTKDPDNSFISYLFRA